MIDAQFFVFCAHFHFPFPQRFEEAYNAELEKGQVSSDTQFSYAWCLIRKGDKNDISKGVFLLQGLYYQYFIIKLEN